MGVLLRDSRPVFGGAWLGSRDRLCAMGAACAVAADLAGFLRERDTRWRRSSPGGQIADIRGTGSTVTRAGALSKPWRSSVRCVSRPGALPSGTRKGA
ncbi:hypothetical protein GCM10007977_038130 [Dactylosporangium sucinum]|uniref:Uncharacterized protein n=1 Tax=Dactylosporangium sucinum TaxID=1424081 RepID=A0A917WV89_9ACTN|nr:hypothetical protein GCM10007977_038130 [Dactylosporangium sucinum]